MTNIEKMLLTEEVADIARTTPSAIANMRHRGIGPRGVKIGKRLLYSESEVLRWLESRVEDQKPA